MALPGRLAWAALLAGALVAGCEGLEGRPEGRDPVGEITQPGSSLPGGDYLFCVTNLGHTLRAFDPAAGTWGYARYLEPDPVGPWLYGTPPTGYYISRVDGGGGGRNALIRFNPRTGVESGRLYFPANSNPNELLILPGSSPLTGWVALRGSSFDNFATNGLAVVNLETLAQTAFFDLNALAPLAGITQTSLLGFVHDPACNAGAGCVYGLVNNWSMSDGYRPGRLLALAAGAAGEPALLDSETLGVNPVLPLLLDEGTGELWVANNGGYSSLCPDADSCAGQPGSLQALDTGRLDNGVPEDAAVIRLGGPGSCAAGAGPCVKYD
ncbi:MAG: hypothetical protein OEZ59_11675, partial [Deltaproteobacteria bacterium]|nr:hypothetical protein [Deltaproteobacteria bacterium]